MALSGNQRPDHSTIASFVSSMRDQILPLFCDILLVCEQENLLGGTFFALDGVKLAANASKECSGTVSEAFADGLIFSFNSMLTGRNLEIYYPKLGNIFPNQKRPIGDLYFI